MSNNLQSQQEEIISKVDNSEIAMKVIIEIIQIKWLKLNASEQRKEETVDLFIRSDCTILHLVNCVCMLYIIKILECKNKTRLF